MKLYVVMASWGKSDDRSEWICGIFDDGDVAKKHVLEGNARIREIIAKSKEWALAWSQLREKHSLTGFMSGYKEAFALLGPQPRTDVDQYWCVPVEMNTFGRWENYP